MKFKNGLENHVQGFGEATDTAITAVSGFVAIPGTQLVIHSISLFNADADSADGTGVELYSNATKIWGPIACPGGKLGSNLDLAEPIVCEPGEAFKFKALNSITTIHLSASGCRIRL